MTVGADNSELFENRATHASRTLMVSDLATLLASVGHGTLEQYKAAILEENVLRRKSASARRKAGQHLRALYFLDKGNSIFSALSTLAAEDEGSVPLLAMLCGATRDLLLRSTAKRVMDTPFGSAITPSDLSAEIEERFPERFSHSNLNRIGTRTLSSWAQSGHLAGRAGKVRDRAKPSVGSVAFALYLGHLSGVRGLPLYETFWAGLLDASEGEMDALAFAASQRGLMEYRRMGDVAEFGFSALEARYREGVSDG